MIVLGFFHNDRDLSATLYQKETSDNFLGEKLCYNVFDTFNHLGARSIPYLVTLIHGTF